MLKEFVREEDQLSPEERKAETDRFQEYVSSVQQKVRDAKLPIVVLVEGWDAAGKGGLINELMSKIDPRFLTVVTGNAIMPETDRYPFLYPYFKVLPENGKMLFLDGGWMDATVHAHVSGKLKGDDYDRRISSINRFERQLRDNGYVVLKIFVHISQKEQKKRMEELLEDRDTAWRVTDADLFQNEHYKEFRKAYDAFMQQTGDITPWYVLDGSGKKRLRYDAFRLLAETIEAALEAGKYCGAPFDEEFPMTETPRLADADLKACIDPADYKRELKELQARIAELQNVLYRRKIPMVVCYEGWDAAGKGGNIRRLAYPLDPRGFVTYPIASPEPHEKNRHFLWRFWTRLPKTGHIAIFDRTWYGRVMVERIEGFCAEDDWKRAYNEINEFEQDLHDWGAVVLKFWIHVNQETQLARFTDRQNTPEKQWKITEEGLAQPREMAAVRAGRVGDAGEDIHGLRAMAYH